MTKKVTDDTSGGDAKGAVESEVRRIRTIRGSEVLGYEGEAHEEHTGEEGSEEEEVEEPEGHLADNDPDQLSPNVRKALNRLVPC